MLQLLLSCVSDFSMSMAFYKGFVFNDWFHETVSVFHDPKIASLEVVKFVHSLGLAFRDNIWMVHAKYHAYMEKTRLILLDDSAFVSISGLVSGFSTGVIKLLGIAKAFGVCFGGSLNILEFSEYVLVCDCLLATGANSLSVYMDGSLSNLGTVGCKAGTAVFFEDIGVDLGVNVSGLMSSTLAKLQAIALALECVPLSSSVRLFSDSQSALDACRSELSLCWVEHHHIVNLICSKSLEVSFYKVKSHSGVLGNERADKIAGATSFSKWYLPFCLSKHFLTANGGVVSGNARHFIRDIYRSEVGSGSEVLVGHLFFEVDWLHSSLVWHLDLHMAMGFISRPSASVRTYFMKALHYWLPVALLNSHVGVWKMLSGFSFFSSDILHLLSFCVSDSSMFMAFFKDFVFNGWFCETVCIFHNPKITVLEIVKFVRFLGLAFRENVWSVHAKHRAYMEKNGLISPDGSAVISVHDLASRFSARVVKLLGITDALSVHFGFRKSCLFFSGVGNSVSVHIDA
ncbi:hypothetical protein G9A89_021501 [Geosiphon pyriformis]|nr:hypothetical protein G9A89_021501 [Geosiphon pyriformis]